MQKNESQAGSAHVAVVTVIIIVLLGALGVVFWNNFLRKDTTVTRTENKPKVEAFCADGENTAAEKGTFCSKELGIKLAVPAIFANKLAKADNYEVFEGSLDPNAKKSAGTSKNVYQATLTGNDNFTFTIAEEPLRTGYVGVYDKLQDTYYDQSTGNLTLVEKPTRYYDSATNSFVVSGSYSKGADVASFNVSGVRFFKGTVGDAGQTENTYFGVVDGKFIKISLKHTGYMGDPANDPSTIDATKVFNELDEAMKALKTVDGNS